MFKLQRYPILLSLFGSFFISSEMLLQHVLPYSPSIGWILGFICFLSLLISLRRIQTTHKARIILRRIIKHASLKKNRAITRSLISN
ncbi:hypothetical protein II5_00121 [Bacillus cereus MSX-A1]|uniref:Uncharacterized protein n=2 Tax=Bacillus cereus TaxID=1396 RepID=A0A9W5VJE2_BACCE|nr:hypothetical protein IC1_00119 [Bacillus cereus VD022]EJR10094.1 hypothetical protein II5_00121 [Bacillus cereus MSX-A1]EOP82343.1 hypothetical protein IGM_05293 [Bacillus cereus HuB4-4]EOQ60124.1 hypothetical protein IAY_04270 [Bacillus cereus TIAC219]